MENNEIESVEIPVVRAQQAPYWTLDVAKKAVEEDHFFHGNRGARESAIREIYYRMTTGLDHIGYNDRMKYGDKIPLIYHKSDTDVYTEMVEAVMTAAKAGSIVVSSFCCPEERRIRRRLLNEQLPFIEVKDNGFQRVYKLKGKELEAYNEGLLMQLTPWKFKFQSHAMVPREMHVVNRSLIGILTGKPDDWWKMYYLQLKTKKKK